MIYQTLKRFLEMKEFSVKLVKRIKSSEMKEFYGKLDNRIKSSYLISMTAKFNS